MLSRPRLKGGAPGDRGSVLLLVPAAVLVLVVLGAIAVDSAVVFLGQHELAGAADAAANDAATALSDRAFYQGGGATQVDAVRAQAALRAGLTADGLSEVTLDRPPTVTVSPDGHQVCVVLSGVVHRIFGQAIPGVPAQVHVHARAVATAVAAGPGTVAVAQPIPNALPCTS